MSTLTSPTSGPQPAGADPIGLSGGSNVGAPTATGYASSGPISPDIASVSTWQLSQIQGYKIDLGAGLGTGGTMTIGQAMSWFQNLPQSQLMQIQSFLYSAGFYTDANGNALQTAPAVGAHDNQSFRAFLEAVVQAYDTGSSVTDVMNSAIQSGQGANNRATLPQAVTGGGNTYNVDLSNPQDVRYTADQIAESVLGRKATDTEVSKITDVLRGQQVSQGLAKEQGSEMSARDRYNTQVNQRNIAYQFQTTPKIAMGPVPNGPFTNPGQAAVALLQYMGGKVTASNVQFLLALSQASGGNGFNLWGVQESTPGSTPGSNGKPQFQSWSQSIQATAQALLSGPYANIAGALMLSGDAASMVSNPTFAAELTKWGAPGIAAKVTDKHVVQQAQQAVDQVAPPGEPNITGGGSAADFRQADQAASGGVGGVGQVIAGGLPGALPSAPQQPDIQGQGSGADFRMAEETTQGNAPASSSSTPAADVIPGQTVTNPGDRYVDPTTVYSVNPASEAAASYNEFTTGGNRIAYGANNYLNAYQAVLAMIKNGGPTG